MSFVQAMMDMFSELGDRIALQYGGSEAHKKVSGSKASKNGELLTSIKRYYSNAFTDMVKQDAMNVFLGFYVPNEKITPLWDLESDYFLHNKALRPPMPLENKILFNELKRKDNFGSTYKYRKGQNTLSEGAGHNDAEIVLKLLASTPDVDVNAVIRQYFFKANQSEAELSASVKKAIERSEKRKAVAREMQDRVMEAVEMWWRDSLQQFFCERAWMCLPMPEGVKQRSYFDRVHKPNELTFFDSIFSGDSNITVTDATVKSDDLGVSTSGFEGHDNDSGGEDEGGDNEESVDGAPSPRPGAVTPLKGKGPSNNSSAAGQASTFTSFSSMFFSKKEGSTLTMEKGVSAGRLGTTVGNTSADDLAGMNDGDKDAEGNTLSGFFVRKYLREKVRQVVGVFGAKKDDENSLSGGQSRGGVRHLGSHKKLAINTSINWSAQTLANTSVVVPQKTSNMYTFYADSWQDNLLLNTSTTSASREDDFKQSLREMSIDVDNVPAMEALSVDSHVSSVVNQGMYKGMNQNESAIDANIFLFTSLINVEQDLRKCLDEEQFVSYTSSQPSAIPDAYVNSSKESHMKAPISTRASVTTHKSVSYDNSVRIPEHVRLKLFDGCVRRKIGFGIESKLQALAARYLFQQVVYAREISIHRLASRLSALTTEKTILDYALTFEKESLVSNLDMITFIATDGPSYQTFYELENFVESLQVLHERYKERAQELIDEYNQLDSAVKGPVVEESDSSEVRLSFDDIEVAERTLISRVTNKEYPGFKCIGLDQYEKLSNPYLHINEIAAMRFEELIQRLSKQQQL
jgi:hypothetical protein